MALTIFNIIVFPGFLFLCLVGMFAEFFDRKFHARMQNRKGPPWYQPAADFIKLCAKEEIIPEEAEPFMFKAMPVVALAAVATSFLYIPLWGVQPLLAFEGDLIIVLYLLTIPTVTFFLAGWFSASLFSMLGAVRSLTQLFAYEVPLFMAVLAPALLADSWSLAGMAGFYREHPFYWLFNLPGFAVALVVLLGKLEKVPFDTPEAETEVVAGAFTEYGGRLLAFFRMAISMETVVAASLLAAVFLPFGLGLGPLAGFVLYLCKIAFIIALLCLLRTIFARLRIDQMVDFCWRRVTPAAIALLLMNILLKGVLPR